MSVDSMLLLLPRMDLLARAPGHRPFGVVLCVHGMAGGRCCCRCLLVPPSPPATLLAAYVHAPADARPSQHHSARVPQHPQSRSAAASRCLVWCGGPLPVVVPAPLSGLARRLALCRRRPRRGSAQENTTGCLSVACTWGRVRDGWRVDSGATPPSLGVPTCELVCVRAACCCYCNPRARTALLNPAGFTSLPRPHGARLDQHVAPPPWRRPHAVSPAPQQTEAAAAAAPTPFQAAIP